jgi:hypothetical protein
MPQVIRKHIVAQSLARLRGQKTHTLFAGYLYLQRRTAQLGRLENLQPDFLSFFKQFFIVNNHPLGAPYIKLFTEQKASAKNLWLNENVAGSYAPSSLRPDQPYRQVVDIEGRKYSLPVDHAQRAFTHLLYSIPVAVADLAVVLYRDFGLSDEIALINDLIAVFAYEFGYANEPDTAPDEAFQLLYSLDTANHWEADWLETL